MIWRNRWFVGLIVGGGAIALVYYEWAVAWNIVTWLVAGLGAYEWARLIGYQQHESKIYAGLFLLLSFVGARYLFDEELRAQEFLFGGITLFWALICPWWLLFRFRPPNLVLAVLGYLLLFVAWYSALILFVSDIFLLATAIAGVCLYDSAAYVIGRTFGRNPLSDMISPKKTKEGFLGGLMVVLMCAWFYHIYIFGNTQSLALLFSVTFAAVVLATLGDLFESLLKRQIGVKDSGRLLGDHGGVLDRLDALLPIFPFISHLSVWLA